MYSFRVYFAGARVDLLLFSCTNPVSIHIPHSLGRFWGFAVPLLLAQSACGWGTMSGIQVREATLLASLRVLDSAVKSRATSQQASGLGSWAAGSSCPAALLQVYLQGSGSATWLYMGDGQLRLDLLPSGFDSTQATPLALSFPSIPSRTSKQAANTRVGRKQN